ncbi:MAG TPA: thioredoxin family protein [Edaphobacter sp.]|nr:thioredoxin family protein [Edaphobacter sp.]
MSTAIMDHEVVSSAKWIEARKELLKKEKELTRQKEEVSRLRRELPWEKVEKTYVFDGPRGKETLSDLFGTNSQLIIYHFMFGPEWSEGCPFCSFLADGIDAAEIHLRNHDVTLLAVSRTPYAKIAAFKERMGWKFKWVSSLGSDFNFDYHVSFQKPGQEGSKEHARAEGQIDYNYGTMPFFSEEMPGTSVFYKDENGDIFHTYSSYARGGEAQLIAYSYLDLTPKGRNETGARRDLTGWVKHHDKYETPAAGSCCGGH